MKKHFDEQNKITREQIVLSEKRLNEDIAGVKKEITGVKKHIAHETTSLKAYIDKGLASMEQSIKDYVNDRLELFKVHFEQQINQLAKKSDLDSLRAEFIHFRLEIEESVDNLKERVGILSQELMDFEQRVNLKLYAIAHDIDALDERLGLVAARSKEDSNALAHSYVRLDNRVAVLEGNN